MRSLVVASLTVLVLVSASSASAREWRNLRIDSSSDSTFQESVQRMRTQLPYHHAVLFDLVLEDLKTFAPTEYRQRLDGLSYRQIARLATPYVMAAYLAHYAGNTPGELTGPTGAVAPAFYPSN